MSNIIESNNFLFKSIEICWTYFYQYFWTDAPCISTKCWLFQWVRCNPDKKLLQCWHSAYRAGCYFIIVSAPHAVSTFSTPCCQHCQHPMLSALSAPHAVSTFSTPCCQHFQHPMLSALSAPHAVSTFSTPCCQHCQHPMLSALSAPHAVSTFSTPCCQHFQHPMLSALSAPHAVSTFSTPCCQHCQHPMLSALSAPHTVSTLYCSSKSPLISLTPPPPSLFW